MNDPEAVLATIGLATIVLLLVLGGGWLMQVLGSRISRRLD